MPTTFSFGIDWQRKGIICWDARPGDALNVLPRPMTYSALDFRTSGVVTSTTLARLATPYGIWAFTIQTGTGANNGFTLGQSNALAVNTIPAAASAPYGVAVWVRGQTGFAGVPFILRVRNQAGTTLFTSSAFNLTSSWQRVSVSGTTAAGTTHLIIEVIKNGSATDVTFQTAGVMLVAGSSVPTGYNAGHASNLFDNITDRVKDANWFLGMRAPYADHASDSMFSLIVTNQDKRYTPENAASPLAGLVTMHRPVEVRSDDGTTTRTHFGGWIESVMPQPEQYGKRTLRIVAMGAMQFLKTTETKVTLQENKKTSDIIAELIKEVVMPPALSQAWVLGRVGNSELGASTYLADTSAYSALDTGTLTLAIAADNWVIDGASDAKKQSFDVYRAIGDVTAAERGRFFFDREGKAIFWNRHRLHSGIDYASPVSRAA